MHEQQGVPASRDALPALVAIEALLLA